MMCENINTFKKRLGFINKSKKNKKKTLHKPLKTKIV